MDLPPARRTRRWLRPAAIAAALGFTLGAALARAQDGAAGGSAATVAAGSAGAAAADGAAAGPLVVAVRSRAHPDRPLQAGLGERVEIEVRGLAAALAGVPNGCAGLILFLDGIPIPGIAPESCTPQTEDGRGGVRFLLDRTEDSDAAWRALLGSPDGLTRTVALAVGPAGDIAWPTRVRDFRLEVLPEGLFLIYLALLAAAVVASVVLVRRTALLRDPHVVPPPGARAPYSLSRFQLFFWTFLALAAYVFIWMITEELDTITGSVLALLGIGSGTALGASLIAQGKAQPAGGGATAGTPAVSGSAAPGAETGAATATAAAAPAAPRVAASQGFLADLLQGPQGLSLYRFQMLGWTLVLGVIFCVEVYGRLAMPDFSPSLLALMGISSATYLGAKFPEE